jgi:5-dehydro-2-deoxygluconokinase
MPDIDVITVGRACVDLYGEQLGGRLEDMRSFRKYVGGSPANMAVGMARLGLKSALITRVGDEHMGRFVREQLSAEGVHVGGVATDPERLTALAILGIRDSNRFPLIFYRENCADMSLCEDDIDPAFVARAQCVIATGTHLSHPRTERAVLKAVQLARRNGRRTVLDIDYRPGLWGLTGHGDGESRFIASAVVTDKLQGHLSLFDLIVGTEEEFHIAGGSTDTLEALRSVRKITSATLVCKRGPLGATAFDGDIPISLDSGLTGPGFPVEVFNVLGAGDGFMSGLMKGWLTGEDWPTSLKYANACGAFAVSRHGCSPAYPSWDELQFFLERGIRSKALREDSALNQRHHSTTRRGTWPQLRVFAFDHRQQLEALVDELEVERSRIPEFKLLCLRAALRVAGGQNGYGILCDGRFGLDALFAAAESELWIGRPVERPGSRPLELEIGPDYGSDLAEWPAGEVVKVLCYYHPDDPVEMKADQEQQLVRLADAVRANDLELLLEIIPSAVAPVTEETVALVIQRVYDIGVFPDWWKLEPLTSHVAWQATTDTITRNDPHSRGILILGLDQPLERLRESFAAAAAFPLVKGFAVGRTIFGDTARAWFSRTISSEDAVSRMAARFAGVCELWDGAGATPVPASQSNRDARA